MAQGNNFTTTNFVCPMCSTSAEPRIEPKGTYCSQCRTKLETCCEGAPLPEVSRNG